MAKTFQTLKSVLASNAVLPVEQQLSASCISCLKSLQLNPLTLPYRLGTTFYYSQHGWPGFEISSLYAR
jgi:hypothetical protein